MEWLPRATTRTALSPGTPITATFAHIVLKMTVDFEGKDLSKSTSEKSNLTSGSLTGTSEFITTSVGCLEWIFVLKNS